MQRATGGIGPKNIKLNFGENRCVLEFAAADQSWTVA